MVVIEWMYSAIQDSRYIELECSEAELAEAKKELSEPEFMYWVQHISCGVSHAQAMEWAREEGGE